MSKTNVPNVDPNVGERLLFSRVVCCGMVVDFVEWVYTESGWRRRNRWGNDLNSLTPFVPDCHQLRRVSKLLTKNRQRLGQNVFSGRNL